jgi:hypothetical protein
MDDTPMAWGKNRGKVSTNKFNMFCYNNRYFCLFWPCDSAVPVWPSLGSRPGNAMACWRPGLQAESKDFTWTRTALSVLINGGLLLPRHALLGPRTETLAACAKSASTMISKATRDGGLAQVSF